MGSTSKRLGSFGMVETVVLERGRCYFGTYRNIAIGVWVAQADRQAAEAALRMKEEMPKRCPGGHSSVVFLLDGLPGPLPEALPLLQKLWEKRTDLACTAMILEGSGFWASGLRSMVNNARREGGGEIPLKMGNSIAEIVHWLSALHAQKTHVLIPPSELTEALTFARKLAEQARTRSEE